MTPSGLAETRSGARRATWAATQAGNSAAVAYMLLFVVTFLGIAYVNIFRPQVVEA